MEGQAYRGTASHPVVQGLKGNLFWNYVLLLPWVRVKLLRLGWMCAARMCDGGDVGVWGWRERRESFRDRMSEQNTRNKWLPSSKPCCKMSPFWEMGSCWLTCKLRHHMLFWCLDNVFFFLKNQSYVLLTLFTFTVSKLLCIFLKKRSNPAPKLCIVCSLKSKSVTRQNVSCVAFS